jgi:chemotaxis regulatin CheY-phosphate phosphatase CheZ
MRTKKEKAIDLPAAIGRLTRELRETRRKLRIATSIIESLRVDPSVPAPPEALKALRHPIGVYYDHEEAP